LGGGIGANFYFFLSKHVEDTVEGLADDELVEIELVGDGIAAGGRLDDVLIFLDDADALQGAVNDGSERACEIGGAGSLEVLGGSGGAACGCGSASLTSTSLVIVQRPASTRAMPRAGTSAGTPRRLSATRVTPLAEATGSLSDSMPRIRAGRMDGVSSSS